MWHLFSAKIKNKEREKVLQELFNYVADTLSTRIDDVKHFNERECAKGSIGFINHLDIHNLVLNFTGRAVKYGE